MFSKLQSGLTYANVMATIAVFLALGGGAYAAFKLPKNSVGSKQIKANAVVSSKVKDGSLVAGDFKVGQLPKGDPCLASDPACRGPKGDTGGTGGIGPSDGYFVKALAQTASVDVPQGSYLVWGQCFKFAASGVTDLTCSIAATQSGGGATTSSEGGNTYAPAGHSATVMAMGTATITNPAGGTITASDSGSTTTAISAVKVGSLHTP